MIFTGDKYIRPTAIFSNFQDWAPLTGPPTSSGPRFWIFYDSGKLIGVTETGGVYIVDLEGNGREWVRQNVDGPSRFFDVTWTGDHLLAVSIFPEGVYMATTTGTWQKTSNIASRSIAWAGTRAVLERSGGIYSIENLLTPWEQWLDRYFPGITDPAIIGPEKDPDRDGYANMLEFASSRDPTKIDSSALIEVRQSGDGTESFVWQESRLGGVTLTPQISARLGVWDDVAGIEIGQPGSNSITMNYTPPSRESLYFRLRAVFVP